MQLKKILCLLVLSVLLFACQKKDEQIMIGSSLEFEDVLKEYFFESVPFGMHTEILDIDTNDIHYNIRSKDGFEVIKYSRNKTEEVILSSSELSNNYITSYVVMDDEIYYILETFSDNQNIKSTSFDVYKHANKESVLLLSVLNDTYHIPKLRVLNGTLYGFFNERVEEGLINDRRDYIYNFETNERVIEFPIITENEIDLGTYWVKESIVGQDYLLLQKGDSFYKFKNDKLEFITDLPVDHIIPVKDQMFVLSHFSGEPIEIMKLKGTNSLEESNIYVEHINPIAVYKDFTLALVQIDSQPQVVVLEIFNNSLMMTTLKSYDGFEPGSDRQDGLFIVTNQKDHKADITVLKVLEY